MKTSLRIALIGVTGNVGQRLLAEALSRGHQVTGIARSVDNVPSEPGLTLFSADAHNPKELAPLLAGHDLVISSIKFTDFDAAKLVEAVRLSGVKRYLVVGGSASLEVSPGVIVLNSGLVPDWGIPVAKAGVDFLNYLKNADDLEWTMLCPAAYFEPGERTGKYRLDDRKLIIGVDGKSSISFEDFAIELLNEAEDPKHIHDYYSIGY